MTTPPSTVASHVPLRRGGRGSRPYLLVPKLIGVAAFLGGELAVWSMLRGPLPETTAGWRERASLVESAYSWVILPGLGLATVCGAGLLLSAWQALLRMRWLLLKLALYFLAVPPLSAWTLLCMRAWRKAIAAQADATTLQSLTGDLRGAVLVGGFLAMMLLVLGRIKPRLGQDYARTFTRLGDPRG